jgi:hypothetical protein
MHGAYEKRNEKRGDVGGSGGWPGAPLAQAGQALTGHANRF